MNNNFITHFSVIEDPRIDRCKKHQLIDILFLSVCAVMSGAEGWEDIEDFGLAKLDWLQKYLPFSNGIPKHDTIARVLSRLNPTTIQRCFIDWVKDIARKIQSQGSSSIFSSVNSTVNKKRWFFSLDSLVG